MGMLNEMFGDSNGTALPSNSELLAKGSYVGDTETILSGYKTFRKKYVYMNLIFKLLVVVVALTSSIMMIISSDKGDIMPIFCLMISIFGGIYFINEPISNKKKLKKALESLQGTEYETQIFSDKVIISTIQDENVETKETEEVSVVTENEIDDNLSCEDTENPDEYEDNRIPATVIHLDSHIVDFLDRDDIFILVVKKSYVFIIPKSAFSKEEIAAVQDKFKLILGVRYKVV